LICFLTALLLGFVGANIILGQGAFLVQLEQSWAAHFESAQVFEYGSPEDFPFEWSVLLKNWDTTLPALTGIILCFRSMPKKIWAVIPFSWLALTLIVFGTHKPWWSYYYVHNAVPLCWCGAVGLAALCETVLHDRRRVRRCLFGLFMLSALCWMGARVYLQISSIRKSPQIFSSLVLGEIAKFKPFTKFIYTDDPVFSFHTGIPLPPGLGVMSLKRFWSGDMTNARLAEELRTVKPGILLLGNTNQELPDLVDELLGFGEFTLVTGKAFAIHQDRNSSSASTSIAKEFRVIENTHYLIESVEFKSIEKDLKKLPGFCHVLVCEQSGGYILPLHIFCFGSGRASGGDELSSLQLASPPVATA